MNKLSSIIVVLSVLLGGCEYGFTPVQIENLTKLCGESGVRYVYRVEMKENYYARCNNGIRIEVTYSDAKAWSKKDGK